MRKKLVNSIWAKDNRKKEKFNIKHKQNISVDKMDSSQHVHNSIQWRRLNEMLYKINNQQPSANSDSISVNVSIELIM